MNELITAQYGVFVINDNTETVKKALGIYVLEDTVISRIEVGAQTDTDVKDNYIKVAATALKAGCLITPIAGDDYFSAVTLTSGSVALILADS